MITWVSEECVNVKSNKSEKETRRERERERERERFCFGNK